MDIPPCTDEVPYLTTAQMIEVDRAMIEEYGITLIQMMENAGRNLAHLARIRFLAGCPRGKQVAILAGTGGNGGGALVCARGLHNYGASVTVYVTRPDEAFTSVPAQQLSILRQMQVPVEQAEALPATSSPDLIIDGLIGYSLKGEPRGTAADMIRWANTQAAPILALDVPSGVEATNGAVFDTAVQATATMTLALPKAGLRAPGVAGHVGELYLADISVPPTLYAKPALNLSVGPIFAQSDLVQLW